MKFILSLGTITNRSTPTITSRERSPGSSTAIDLFLLPECGPLGFDTRYLHLSIKLGHTCSHCQSLPSNATCTMHDVQTIGIVSLRASVCLTIWLCFRTFVRTPLVLSQSVNYGYTLQSESVSKLSLQPSLRKSFGLRCTPSPRPLSPEAGRGRVFPVRDAWVVDSPDACWACIDHPQFQARPVAWNGTLSFQ